MTGSFPLTEMQKMYLNGEKSDFFLGGKPAFLYFRTEIENFDREKFEKAFSAVILKNTLLNCDITDRCVRNDRIKPDVSYYISENVPEEDRRIADVMCNELRNAGTRKNYLVSVLELPDTTAHVHFVFSNLVLDGISVGLILKQLRSFYEHGTLPETTNYAEYVGDTEKYLHSEEYREDRNYFENLYKDFRPDEFEFPYLKKPEEIKNCEFLQKQKIIEREVYEKLEETAKKYGISTFVLLMTVFGKITERYSGNKRFFLNVPCSLRGRNQAEVNETAGLFSNFMIVPFGVSEQSSVLEAASKFAPLFRETAKHRKFPGGEAVRMLRQNGVNNDSMNIVFTVVPVPGTETSYPLKELRACTNQTVLECDLYVQDHRANLCLSCPEGLYAEGFIDSLGDMMVKACAELSENDGLSTLDLPDRELRLVEEANGISYDFERTALNEVISRAFIRNQDRKFLICGNRSYTYGEILRKAYSVSKKADFQGKRVALLLPKCEGLIVGQYAALLFAGAYMPFDTSLSAAEIAHCMKAAEITEIITCSDFSEKLGSIEGIRIICIDKTDVPTEEISVREIIENIRPASGEDIRAVINTSGTTGRPKSILLTDGNLVNCFFNAMKIFGIEENSGILSLTNFGHDMAIFDTLIVNFINGFIILPTEKEAKEPAAWARLVRDYRASVWQGVPSFMEMMMTYLEDAEPDAEFPSIKQVIHGGEFLTPALAGKIMKRFPNVSLFNVCGPAETTIWNIFHKITAEDIENGVLPIGVPFSGVEYHILNEELEECPVGVKGIIYCAGESLSPGYAGNAEETAKKFIFWNGIRIYNTGDIGYRREDGEIVICGRKDFQVKIHGKRVELAGINAVLASHPAVGAVSTVYLEEQSKLAAVYTGDGSVKDSELTEYLRKNLPDYMIPKMYIRIDSIPLSRTGKPDHRALAEIVKQRLEQQKKETLSSSEAESGGLRTEILEIIEEETDEEVTEEMNFFEAGGDSLSAVKVAAKAGRLTGKKLAVFDLIESETIGSWLDMIL